MAEETVYQKSLREQGELRDMNERLIEFLERPRPKATAPEAHEWACLLNEQLVQLHQKISLHFREEDGAGVLSRLAEHYPHAAERLEALRGEHDRIHDDLQQIVSASMSYAAAKTPDNPKLRERTRALLDTIAQHESRETALILDLISTDVGSGG